MERRDKFIISSSSHYNGRYKILRKEGGDYTLKRDWLAEIMIIPKKILLFIFTRFYERH